MDEAKKKLITEKTVNAFNISYNVRFGIAAGVTGASAILALILFPTIPVKLVVFFICAGFCAIFTVARVKKGKMKYFFRELAVTEKQIRNRYTGEDEATPTNYLFFGEFNYIVLDADYNSTNIGDRFYVLFDAKSEDIVEIYSVNEYELAPNLDFRE